MAIGARPALAVLDTAATGAAAGRGAVLVVTGEAGIGKSALVRAWCAGVAGRVRVLGAHATTW
jgi:predicted ATPase